MTITGSSGGIILTGKIILQLGFENVAVVRINWAAADILTGFSYKKMFERLTGTEKTVLSIKAR